MDTNIIDRMHHIVETILLQKGITKEQLPLFLSDSPVPMTDLFPVVLGDSTIHGKGLFATRFVAKGKVLTMYPCHMLVVQKNGVRKLYGAKQSLAECPMEYAQFLKEDDGQQVFAVGDPSLPFNASRAAHYINDPYPHVLKIQGLTKTTDIVTFGKTFVDYKLRTGQLANCGIVTMQNYAYAVALRDIQQGEELMAAYDFGYWYKDGNAMDIVTLLKKYIQGLSPKQRQYVQNNVL